MTRRPAMGEGTIVRMRRVPWILALLLALSAVLPAVALGAKPDPKVVVIVGPVGEATERYLARGEAAAREAERFSSNVVRVFTPNATWPAVKRAIQGASMVIYLGHGNGWPSMYRNELYPPTQNGFGLNPVAGAGNEAHQYFGEGRIAADVKLAKNAVVLLHHLCYASGNTEPGLPVGTEAESRQRVDNYAAGFIKAGASAVLAEGHIPPAYYVRSILSGKQSIEKIWQSSPSANGNMFTFASQRSKGFTAAMDPDRPGHGYYRSLVVRSGLLPADVAAGATVSASIPVGHHADPTLIGSGVTLSTPYVKGRLLAGQEASLWIPYTVEGSGLPELTVGVRWDPIDVAETLPDGLSLGQPAGPAPAVEQAPAIAAPAAPAASPPAASEPPPTSDPSPGPVKTDDLSGDPFAVPETPVVPSSPSPDPSAEPAAGAPQVPDVEDPSTARLSLVEPEQIGSVVEPVKVAGGPTRIIVPLTLPTQPGRYRLVATLHDATGVAYDAATQSLLSGLLVRVSGDVGARYLVGKTATATAGEQFELRTAVANVGSTSWGRNGVAGARHGDEALQATLIGHWVSLTPSAEAVPADIRFQLPAGLPGGATARTTLVGTAPAAPGQYLLVIDVIDPRLGSLAAIGIEPALVRVTVEAAAN